MKIRNLDDLRNATDETTVKTIVTEYMMESIARNNILAKLEVDLDEKDDTETITIAELHIALLSVWMDYKGILPFFTSDEKENAMDCILEYYPKYFQMDWSIMLPIGTLDDPEGRIGKGISRTDARKAIRGQNANNDRRPIPCICVDTGKEYRSFTQAAKDIGGANSRQIMDCCYGARNDIKGYRFKLKERE